MSGIAVIYNRDGRPAERGLLTKMLAAISHRGPDGLAGWVDGPVGLGHAMLVTTPEAVHESQLLRDAKAGLCLSFDGRVDNREDLAEALASRSVEIRNDSDAELVLRAYECWGEDSPEKIIGDFAYVVSDARRRQLFCARDILGIKPFYYFLDQRVFLAGSELQQILSYPGVPLQPNEGMIAEYLAVNINTRDETLYQNIFRLVPGCCLVVGSEGVRKRSYYDLHSAREAHFSTNDQYADRFREIFREAVRCRLRSAGPLIAHLSGGVDSSAVVGMAAHLVQSGAGAVKGHGFQTASLVFAEPESDEREHIAQMDAMWGLNSRRLAPFESDQKSVISQVGRYKDIPEYPNGMMVNSLRQMARSEGSRVCLTGLWSDEWLSGCDRFADYLLQLRFGALARDLRLGRPVLDHGRPTPDVSDLRMVLRWGVWPLVSPLLGARGCRAVRKLIGRETLPPFLARELAKRVSLEDRLRQEPIRRTCRTFSQQEIYNRFVSGELTHGSEIVERTASWYGLEERHPFADRRLIEYAFVLPQSQRFDSPFTKVVLRNALSGLLPESIRLRRSKADFSHVFAKALERLGGKHFFDSLMLAQMGYVNGAAAGRAYATFIHGYRTGDRSYNTYMWSLWMVFAVEIWLRTVFDPQISGAVSRSGFRTSAALFETVSS